MKDSDSVRSYFLQLVALMVFGIVFFGAISLYLIGNYRDISIHFIEDDIVFIEELSSYSREVTSANIKIVNIIKSQPSSLGVVDDKITSQIDRVRKVIAKIRDPDSGTRLHGEPGEMVTVAKPLIEPLNGYLNSMIDAVDAKIYGSPDANDFIEKSQDRYSDFIIEISNLIVSVGDEVEMEHEKEMVETDGVFVLLGLASGVGLLGVLIWMTYRANHLSNDLEQIRLALLYLGNGETEVDIPDALKQQELQLMADSLRTFRATQCYLQHTLQELSDIKSELEQRVESRTEALAIEVEQHKKARVRLQLAAEVMRSTSEAVVISDAENNVVDVNDAYCEITGYSREDIIGSNPSRVRSGLHDGKFYEMMWRSLAQKDYWKGEIWDRRKSGEIYPKWLTINVVRNSEGVLTNYVGVFTDISDLKSKEAQLQKLAHFDPLTNLPNRVLCQERVEQQLIYAERHQSKTAILFIDLDRFKYINDSLGHAAGDELLIEVAQRLEKSLKIKDTQGRPYRKNGHTVARLGGDEFIVALSGFVEIDALAEIIERLQNSIRKPINISGKQVSVDSSIGVSIYPEDGRTYGELSRHADTAMYRAKSAGRNQFVFFTEDMNQQAHRRLELEIEMRRALEKGQFEIHYQSKVCTQNNQIHGMEALVRWVHPDKGMIPPMEFIQVAEDIGLIIPLGEWILYEACSFCKHINETRDVPLQVAVNISPRQFADQDLLSKIEKVLKRSGLPPQYLELEITESVVMGDVNDAISTIKKIRSLGVNIALDDFGTGYSSLSYLKQLPIDTLKIDRSFVAHLDNQGRDKDWAIVEAIIRMGQHLDMAIVAEGVENELHGQQLKCQGCDLLQGYHYSKPLAADDFSEYLLKQSDVEMEPVV